MAEDAEVRPLTATEVVIADLAVRGCGTDEIARELRLSARAVERHLVRVYRKLGAGPGAELAARITTERRHSR
jgi:DNA-binding NarL/FixJ family response regulator